MVETRRTVSLPMPLAARMTVDGSVREVDDKPSGSRYEPKADRLFKLAGLVHQIVKLSAFRRSSIRRTDEDSS
jgi:hypothetical protein